MPLYDYKCSECKKRFTLLIGVVAEQPDERCPHCGSTAIARLISRFARARSEDDLLDSLADPSKMGDIEDPKELHSFMKRMGREMGEEVGGDLEELLEGSEEESSASDEQV